MIVELREGTLVERAPDRFGTMLPRPMVGQDAVHRDGPQPAAKGAVALALEARELLDQNVHDILDNIFSFIAQRGIAQQPTLDQRPVDVIQSPPCGFVRSGAQPLQQADGSLH